MPSRLYNSGRFAELLPLLVTGTRMAQIELKRAETHTKVKHNPHVNISAYLQRLLLLKFRQSPAKSPYNRHCLKPLGEFDTLLFEFKIKNNFIYFEFCGSIAQKRRQCEFTHTCGQANWHCKIAVARFVKQTPLNASICMQTLRPRFRPASDPATTTTPPTHLNTNLMPDWLLFG